MHLKKPQTNQSTNQPTKQNKSAFLPELNGKVEFRQNECLYIANYLNYFLWFTVNGLN